VRGARRQEFDTHDLMARTIFACGADIVAIGGAFQVVLGCKTAIMDALALIKSEEEARRTEIRRCTLSSRSYRQRMGTQMIGNEKVSLLPALGDVYGDIQREVNASPDRELWYGPMPARKALGRSEGGTATIVPFVFIVAAVALLVDAFGDTASDWNRWNATFFTITLGALIIGFALSIVAIEPRDVHWKRHKLIIRLGDRVNIGVGDIWQNRANGICILDCSLLDTFRGKGLGSVATRMMIRKCFTELGARRIESSALSTNPRSLKMNDRMIEEGVLKERYLIRGQPADEHLYRLLKSEWLAQLAT
jgi:RimJ/RimL family protein N-acetyltransferase